MVIPSRIIVQTSPINLFLLKNFHLPQFDYQLFYRTNRRIHTMTVEAHKETLGFQAEVKQLLNLMIHSLYSNKEDFPARTDFQCFRCGR